MVKLLATHRKRAGFTLVELIVTFIVLGILSAIVYPIITSVADSNQNSITSQRLERLATAEESFEASFGSFTGWQGDFSTEQVGDFIMVPGASTDANTVSVSVSTDGYLALANLVGSNCNWEELAPATQGGNLTTGVSTDGQCLSSDHLPGGSTLRIFTGSAKP